MPMGWVFWGLMLLWLVFGIYRDWGNHYLVGVNLLVFFLFGLLGWRVFGAAIH